MNCTRNQTTTLLMVFVACLMHSILFVYFTLYLCVMVVNPHIENKDCGYEGNSLYYTRGPFYNWSYSIQAFLLGAYGFGYLAIQLPSGWIVKKIGARWTTFIAYSTSSAATCLIPISANLHWAMVFILRVYVGLAGGTTLESIRALLLWWIPVGERYQAHRIVRVGGLSGIAIAWVMSGALLVPLKWTSCHYVLAVLVFGLAVLWLLVVRDQPETLSERESEASFADAHDDIIPLRGVVSSCPFLALAILAFADLWGLSFFILLAPKFVYDIIGIGVMLTALVSAGAMMMRLLSVIVFELITKTLLEKNMLDRTTLRKLFVILSHIFTGFTLAILGYVGCSPFWAIAILCVAALFSGGSSVTNNANSQDLSPTFAYAVFLLINFIGLSSQFFIAQFSGFILAAEKGLESWKYVFWMISLVYIAAGLVFLIFGSAQVQPWNFPHLMYMAAASHKDIMSVAYASRDIRKLEPPTPPPTM